MVLGFYAPPFAVAIRVFFAGRPDAVGMIA
jgi:hypothetical protein